MMQGTLAYDKIATRFADRWFDLRLEENMARFAGRLGPGARVLDVGCGPGRDAAWLAEQGYDAGGVDLSIRMLRQGQARGVTAPLIQADMRHLPFRRGSFQGLWACASLLHLPKEQAGDALLELGVVDEIVPEPEGGAHRGYQETASFLRTALKRNLDEICSAPLPELVAARYQKFRKMGVYKE